MDKNFSEILPDSAPDYWTVCEDFYKESYLVKVLVAQSCPLLWDPMDCSPPGSSVHGIFQARILEWVANSSSGGIFLTQELNLSLLHFLHCKQILLPSEPPRKPVSLIWNVQKRANI